MATLHNTSFDWIYSFFNVATDNELIYKMSTIGFIYMVVTGIWSIFMPAPYGRYSKALLGPAIKAQWGWMIQECPSFLIAAFIIYSTPCEMLWQNHLNLISLALFCLHYFHRAFVYPLRFSGEAKPVAVVIMLSAFLFCLFNGFLQSHSIANVTIIDLNSCSWIPYYFRLSGIPIFLIGFWINVYHDALLIKLKANAKQSGKSGYTIPIGGLFHYVSCANYFGEILEWIAFAVITLGYPQITFALFSAMFLGLRGYHHHNYYKTTFGEKYPPNRKAVIPFVF